MQFVEHVHEINKLILNRKSSTDLHSMIAQALFSPVQYVAFILNMWLRVTKCSLTRHCKCNSPLIYQDPCTLNLWH